VLGFVVLVSSTALAAGPAFARQHLIRGKMRTDGLLTVGQQETVSLRNLPPKSSLGIQIRPAGECFSPEQNGLCLPEPAYPVPGTPKFKTTGKGRARLTFVMPSGNLFLDFSDPLQSHPISFANGQVVRVEALGIEFTGRLQFSKASTSAAVEVPPSP
jgi:hypothetical protein